MAIDVIEKQSRRAPSINVLLLLLLRERRERERGARAIKTLSTSFLKCDALAPARGTILKESEAACFALYIHTHKRDFLFDCSCKQNNFYTKSFLFVYTRFLIYKVYYAHSPCHHYTPHLYMETFENEASHPFQSKINPTPFNIHILALSHFPLYIFTTRGAGGY